MQVLPPALILTRMAAIQNLEALAVNDLRKDALVIAETGYAAIDTNTVLARKLRVEGDKLSIGDKDFPLAGRRIFSSASASAPSPRPGLLKKFSATNWLAALRWMYQPMNRPTANVQQ